MTTFVHYFNSHLFFWLLLLLPPESGAHLMIDFSICMQFCSFHENFAYSNSQKHMCHSRSSFLVWHIPHAATCLCLVLQNLTVCLINEQLWSYYMCPTFSRLVSKVAIDRKSALMSVLQYVSQKRTMAIFKTWPLNLGIVYYFALAQLNVQF